MTRALLAATQPAGEKIYVWRERAETSFGELVCRIAPLPLGWRTAVRLVS